MSHASKRKVSKRESEILLAIYLLSKLKLNIVISVGAWAKKGSFASLARG
jgi:hypothetical protein